MGKKKEMLSKMKVCRFCLANDDSQLMSIYKKDSSKVAPLEMQIITCTSIEIFPKDGLPKLICKGCIEKINQFYIFKKNCKKVDIALKNFIDSGELIAPNYSRKRRASSTDVVVPIKDITIENTAELVDAHQTKKVKLEDGTEIITLCITSAPGSDSTMDDSSQGSMANEEEELDEMGDENDYILEPRQVETDVFPCTECDETFPLKQLLDLHAYNHRRGRQFSCDTCDEVFPNKSDLHDHEKTHIDDGPFSCSTCQKVFPRKPLLRKHELSHADAEKYICVKCDRSFPEKHELVAHFKRHSKKRPFACKECDKSFVFKQGLERHMVSMHAEHKPHKCNYCEASFNSQIRLTRHITMHAGLRPYPCKICNRTFLLNHHLTRHMRSHYAAGQRNPEEVIGQHKCDLCSMSFRRKDSLVNHSAIHSMVNLKCVICNTSFHTADMVKEHITTHLQGLPFPCENCDYSFETKAQLEEHELKHAEMEYEEQIEKEVLSEAKKKKKLDLENDYEEGQKIADFHITDINNPEVVPCEYNLKGALGSIDFDKYPKSNDVETELEQESIPPVIRTEGIKMYQRKGPIQRKIPSLSIHTDSLDTAPLEQINENPRTNPDDHRTPSTSKLPVNVSSSEKVVKVQKYIISKDEMKKMAKLGILEVKNGQVIMKSPGKSIINATMKPVEPSDIENLLNNQKSGMYSESHGDKRRGNINCSFDDFE